MNTTPTSQLRRSRHDRIVAGVAGGIGHYLAIDPIFVRLTFVLLTTSGIGPVVYLILWIVIPRAPETPAAGVAASVAPGTGGPPRPADSGVQEIPIANVQPPRSSTPRQRTSKLGTVLVVLGITLLLHYLAPWIFPFIVPMVLIAAGALLLYRTRQPSGPGA